MTDPIKPEDRAAFIAALQHSHDTSLVVTPELFDDLPPELKKAVDEKLKRAGLSQVERQKFKQEFEL